MFLEVTVSLVPSTYLSTADVRMCHDSTVKCVLFFVDACCSCVERT